jgi:DNA-binding PucR family transcriptional regulator
MLAALPEQDQDVLLAPLRAVLDLQPHHRDAYIRTLDALHRHGGTVLRAAELLHVHANTVRYRINRIEEMTHLRLDNPHDRLRLDLAATLVRLRGWPPYRGDFGIASRQHPEPDESYRASAA